MILLNETALEQENREEAKRLMSLIPRACSLLLYNVRTGMGKSPKLRDGTHVLQVTVQFQSLASSLVETTSSGKAAKDTCMKL